ncbi:S-adenosyl-L-methionine-dependent methyltransferase [Panus rudis PR-1116 ss-1]|nr:S-adenosyl-L-methionine-dependent methyltransferase [Panus rudis PR-1116 ss-1]
MQSSSRSLLTFGSSTLRQSPRHNLPHPASSPFRHSRRHFHDPKPLPPYKEWRKHFTATTRETRDRVSVANPETAKKLAEAFVTQGTAAGEGKVIIEAFPGPGALSRALLELPKSKVKRLIILEHNPEYLAYLTPLEQADDRVTVIPKTGFDWDTYTAIEEQGLLDGVEKLDFSAGVHPQLHFISHLPFSSHGEQLITQLFRTIPEKIWLFKRGRVPMSFILSAGLVDRLTAPPGATVRSKAGVIAEATSEMRYPVRPSELVPYDDHFHPIVVESKRPKKKNSSRKLGHPHLALTIVPNAEQIIPEGSLEIWDYVLRRLFAQKSTSLKDALKHLAPGATSLLKTLTSPDVPPEERVNVDLRIKDLDLKDWTLVVRAFVAWPFKPDDLTIEIYASDSP